MSFPSAGLPIQRLNGGKPIIAPTENDWESGVTFNSAAILVERSPSSDKILRRLLNTDDLAAPHLSSRIADGVVALHYRARPKSDPNRPWNRSSMGLALFTPTLELLKRYELPVLAPGDNPADVDHLGVEDPRITRIDDIYYAVYCGVSARHDGAGEWRAANCLASSCDLLHWTRQGAMPGDFPLANNKDGVLFPDAIDGRYLLLHRPMLGDASDYSIALAVSPSLQGPWHDHGPILHATPNPACSASWVGAGSVPIPLGGRRYLVIFHTGNRLRSGEREYDLDAAIFNFQEFTAARPTVRVERRLDRIMVPETEFEIGAPYADSVSNVLFACGSYIHGDDLTLIYGGGDTYILAAKVKLSALLERLESSKTGLM